jgi:hypothetical protein
VRAYDLGGRQRDIWSDYLVSSGCVVFVVDASDPERFAESKAELDVRLRIFSSFFFFLFLFSFFFFFLFFSFFLFLFFSFFLFFFFFRDIWAFWTLGASAPTGPLGPLGSSVSFFTFYFFFGALLGPTFERGPVRRAVRRVREQVRPGRVCF